MATVLGLCAIWELSSRAELVPGPLFPPPSAVLGAAVEWARSGELSRDVLASLWRAAAGYGIGALLGITLALLTGRIPLVNQLLRPALHALRPIPPVAMVPLIIVWLGIGDAAKVFAIALASFFPVWIAAHQGAQEVPDPYLWSAELLGAKRGRVFLRVVLPSTMTAAASGLRTAISVAFVMVFVSELAGASSGIGYQIAASHLAYRIDRMLAAMAVLGALGALSDWLLLRTLRALMPWREVRDA